MLTKELEVAKRLSVEAGRIIMKFYLQDVEVRFKKEREPVTEADRASNEFITTQLREAFPDDGILAEESRDDLLRLNKERVWCVDPMDGTREFLDQNGQFAVMIGLIEAHRAVLGVVYQPTTDRMFWAAKGGGAFVEEAGQVEKLRVSSVDRITEMRLVVSRSHRSHLINSIRTTLGINQEVASGSVGLKVGLLARSKSDLYIHPNSKTKEWDTCAPQIILEEAGGRMTDCWGKPMRYNKTNVFNGSGYIAGNGKAHAEIQKKIEPLLSQMD